jgi:hypothetical protein
MTSVLVGLAAAGVFLLASYFVRRSQESISTTRKTRNGRPTTLDDYRDAIPFVMTDGAVLYGIRRIRGEGWTYIAIRPRRLLFSKVVDGATMLDRSDLDSLVAERKLVGLPPAAARTAWLKHFAK